MSSSYDFIKIIFVLSLIIFCILIILKCYYLRDKLMDLEKQVGSIRDILGKFIHEVKNTRTEMTHQQTQPQQQIHTAAKLPSILEEEEELFNQIKTFDLEAEDIDDDEDDVLEEEEGEYEYDDEEEEIEVEKIIHIEEEIYDTNECDLNIENTEEEYNELPAATLQQADEIEIDVEPPIEEMTVKENSLAIHSNGGATYQTMTAVALGSTTQSENTAELIEPSQETPFLEEMESVVESVIESVIEPESVIVADEMFKSNTLLPIEQYKKMNLTQLKHVVLSKGLATSVNKYKKDELIKILQDQQTIV